MDTILDEIDKDITDTISNVNIEAVIDNPEMAIFDLIEFIKSEIVPKHLKAAVSAGEDFARAISKDGEIVIQDTTDPKENA
jgi:hypothetical protein